MLTLCHCHLIHATFSHALDKLVNLSVVWIHIHYHVENI